MDIISEVANSGEACKERFSLTLYLFVVVISSSSSSPLPWLVNRLLLSRCRQYSRVLRCPNCRIMGGDDVRLSMNLIKGRIVSVLERGLLGRNIRLSTIGTFARGAVTSIPKMLLSSYLISKSILPTVTLKLNIQWSRDPSRKEM